MHVAVNYVKVFIVAKDIRQWPLSLCCRATISFYLRRPVMCPILTKFRSYRHFHTILQYQISRKSVQWESRRYLRRDGRTGRRDEGNRLFFFSPRRTRRRLEVCHCLTSYSELLHPLYWFGGTRIRPSALRPVILAEILVPFLVSPRQILWSLPFIRARLFTSTSLPVRYFSTF